MINQFEIPMFLEESLPEMSSDLSPKDKKDAYSLIKALAAFTFKNVKAHNYQVAKRCFMIADKFHRKGNTVVKSAIQNVFIYSFSRMFQSTEEDKKQLLRIIPVTLYSLYVMQMCHKGC